MPHDTAVKDKKKNLHDAGTLQVRTIFSECDDSFPCNAP